MSQNKAGYSGSCSQNMERFSNCDMGGSKIPIQKTPERSTTWPHRDVEKKPYGWTLNTQIYSYIVDSTRKFMRQALEKQSQWTFKCHFCKHESHDSVEIGIHLLEEHNYNFINDESLI